MGFFGSLAAMVANCPAASWAGARRQRRDATSPFGSAAYRQSSLTAAALERTATGGKGGRPSCSAEA